MARADRDPRAATERACARCHTTAGFLARTAPEFAAIDRRAPREVGPVGVGCAACHAVHEHGGHTRAPGLALLRTVPRPELLGDAAVPPPAETSGVCLGCHTPEVAEGAPSASAAALWLGRGGLEPSTGAALSGPAPHGALAGGCVGCHQAGPAVERGGGHAFVAGTAACARCHAQPPPADDLASRARALWSTWLASAGPGAAGGAGPPHARAARLDRATPLGRAAWDVALGLEDPAGAAHNAPYARQLLAAAERAFNGRVAPGDQGGRE
jgi:hypothetical protein